MMAGNPNWWSMMNNGMHPQLSHHHQLSNSSDQSSFIYGGGSTSPPLSSDPSPLPDHHHHSDHHDFPVKSWSQMLLGGIGGEEEERFGASLFQQQKKLESWEEQVLNLNPLLLSSSFTATSVPVVDVKQEALVAADQQSCCTTQINYGHVLLEDDDDNDQFQPNNHNNYSNNCNWAVNNSHHHHQLVMPVSSPTSCITTLSNNILNFSRGKQAATQRKNQQHNQDHSSESNSTNSGGVSKKARVQQSSAQPALKVRKEKLGDRITALHQLVSPFGKTDTASVLSEAIGYIRFLQTQIEALSSPYMRNAAGNTVQERNCVFPEEHCQFLNGFGVDGRGASKQDQVNDLRSRGLCLVPISCTLNVGNDNAADYWAPAAALGGGF